MCGITGALAFTEEGRKFLDRTQDAISKLKQRGPDANGIYIHENIALGHTRLSVIDTTDAAAQPFTDASGRYTIVFNGEIFNYKELRKGLQDKGFRFRSESDTEVLLYLFISEGTACYPKLNGFFAFAIYDNEEEVLFLARDRFGVKPLLWYRDEDKFIFGSEMKSMLTYGLDKTIDKAALFTYLQLNYIHQHFSIFKGINKVKPGEHLIVRRKQKKVHLDNYYRIPKGHTVSTSKQELEKQLHDLLEDAVQRRLVADVPLGTFLSGGIDSSIITALAARHTKHLKTFSIGFKDEPMFDETHYAQLVAKKHRTDHTVFELTNDDLFSNLHAMLDYIDEPFADSSALAVHILSMHTRKHVTVALSGDGADEIFGGYNKHMAEYRVQHQGLTEKLVKLGAPLWELLPKSRNSAAGNKARQLQKFSAGMQLSPKERYWQWASLATEQEAASIYPGATPSDADSSYLYWKEKALENITGSNDFNEILYTDMQLVLANDMLTKVDMMSMANSLEVRTPFLDYRVVDLVFSIPAQYKIDRQGRKKILKDAFAHLLPEELMARGKQGFEVPLLKWFRTELRDMIENEYLSKDFICEQGLFNAEAVESLRLKLYSKDPGDAVARVWALIVFQHWWKKYML